ncbi:MAG: 2'-5' RNA ligase family protein [Ferruginibacter sp.]
MSAFPPLIITLTLDTPSQEYFTALRNQYFPKHCNYLQAHLTLFHQLPSNNLLINETLQALANRAAIQLEVDGIKSIGNGVVYTVVAGELLALHKLMQQSFDSYLVAQDRQRLWPHITVQNKVTAFKAKQTLDILSADFKPFNITAIGFSTWLYLKGPWKHEQDYLFKNIV